MCNEDIDVEQHTSASELWQLEGCITWNVTAFKDTNSLILTNKPKNRLREAMRRLRW